MKMQTIGEYVAKHEKDFFVYDERIDDYLFDGDLIDTNHKDWEVVKDYEVIKTDETTNEFPTLVICTEEEETEEEYNGCLRFNNKEEYDAYWAHLERDCRD